MCGVPPSWFTFFVRCPLPHQCSFVPLPHSALPWIWSKADLEIVVGHRNLLNLDPECGTSSPTCSFNKNYLIIIKCCRTKVGPTKVHLIMLQLRYRYSRWCNSSNHTKQSKVWSKSSSYYVILSDVFLKYVCHKKQPLCKLCKLNETVGAKF